MKTTDQIFFFFILSEKVVAFSDSTTKCLLNTQDKIFILWKSPVNTFSGKSTTIRLNWKLISNKKQKGQNFLKLISEEHLQRKKSFFLTKKALAKVICWTILSVIGQDIYLMFARKKIGRLRQTKYFLSLIL